MRNADAVPHLDAFDTSDAGEFDREMPTAERRWPSGSQPIPSVVSLHHLGDLSVQVQVDSSVWHRKAVGGHETACGRPINYARIVGLRQESYLGDLCQLGCFSHHELDTLAPKARTQEQERERKATDRMDRLQKDTDTGRWPLITPDDLKPKK